MPSPGLALSECHSSQWLGSLLINAASPFFSCVAGPQEKEEAGETAHAGRWHAVHRRVPAGGPGELAHQRRGAQEHGPRGQSHEGHPRGHVSDPAVPRSHRWPQCWELGDDSGWDGPTLLRRFDVLEWNAPSEKGQKS